MHLAVYLESFGGLTIPWKLNIIMNTVSKVLSVTINSLCFRGLHDIRSSLFIVSEGVSPSLGSLVIGGILPNVVALLPA